MPGHKTQKQNKARKSSEGFRRLGPLMPDISIFRKAVINAAGSWRLFIGAVSLDFAFLFLLGLVFPPVLGYKLDEYLTAIGTSLVESAGEVSGRRISESFVYDVFAGSPELQAYVRGFILLVLFSIALLFVLYVFFQSLSWLLCLRVAGRKTPYHAFLRGFAVSSLFWLAVFAVIQAAFLISSLNRVLSGALPETGQANWAANLLIFLFAYFSFLTYSQIGLARHPVFASLKLGVAGFRRLAIPWAAFFLFAVLAQAAYSYLAPLFVSSVIFGAAYQGLVILPAVSLLRIYLLMDVSAGKTTKFK